MRIPVSLVRELQRHKQIDGFTNDYDALCTRDANGKSYANTIAGCMDIAYSLNELDIPYCIIGGLAVAFHVHQTNHKEFLDWRGTQDIDILVNKKSAECVLKSAGYEFRHFLPNMPGSLNGVYEYAKDENGESLSLGLRETVHDRHNSDIAKKLLRSATSIDLYSVPVRVPMIRDLVAMKRHANRPKDRSDIKLLKTFYPGVKV